MSASDTEEGKNPVVISEEIKEELKKQKSLGEELDTLLINYKKEPSKRKTVQRLQKIEDKAKEIWKKFDDQHKILIETGEISASQYIVDNYHEFVGEKFKKISDRLAEDRETIVPGGSSFSSEFGRLNSLRASSLQTLEQFVVVNANFEDEEPLVGEVELLITTLKKLFANFENANLAVSGGVSESPDSEFDAIMVTCRSLLDRFEAYVADTQQEDQEAPRPNNSGTDSYMVDVRRLVTALSAPRHQIKLPSIELTKFSGDFDRWISFRDLFESTIRSNSSLDNAQKMYYLKMYVVGAAADVIRHLSAGAGSFNIAWALLKRRYDNQKVLVNTLLDKFVNLKSVQHEKASELRSLLDHSKEIIYSLEELKQPISNAMIVYFVTRKLSHETRSLWEQSCGESTSIPTFQKLDDFLENRVRTLYSLSLKGQDVGRSQRTQVAHSAVVSKPSTATSSSKGLLSKCTYCAGSHFLFRCPKFDALTVSDRWAVVQSKKLCSRCLNEHALESCKFTWKCQVCNQPHNTKLHKEHGSVSTCGTGESSVVLATAGIEVLSSHDIPFHFKVLIDQGSMHSFISERAMNLLNLSRSSNSTPIAGIGGKIAHARGVAELRFNSVYDSKRVFSTQALILPRITGELSPISKTILSEIPKVRLADPEFYKGGSVDILLGAGIIQDLLCPGLKKGRNSLIAQNTHLGWIISGLFQTTTKTMFSLVGVDSLPEDDSLTKFWETEEKVIDRNEFSAEENACEAFYQQTTTIGSDGRYICRLPFREDASLGRSRLIAVRNMEQLEKRFAKSPQFKERYVTAMNDYFESNHARVVPESDVNEQSYYIPHLAVIKESSLSTKTRIVFNASSPSSNKKSLNEVLMVGPKIQRDLVDKIISFRLFKHVFTCDIVKMYRQINMHPDDWKFQRFVWRVNPDEPLKECCLTTVTFGTASAPFTAIRTLKQVAIDQEHKFPVASKILMDDCYVDDIHFGSDDIELVRRGREELISALKCASFEVRKFASNNKNVISDLPDEFIDFNEEHKFMGLSWNSSKDQFQISNFEFIRDKVVTKRIVLTNIARIFDPVGWLQPLIVTAKILLQDLWKADLDWDDIVPSELLERWLLIEKSLSDLSFISVPRYFSPGVNEHVELHGFGDASQKAYGAVVYLKTANSVHFVLAKSRVAQIKMMSIPRLELKAALLLTELLERAINLLQRKGFSPKVYAWSDSKVVLAWLRGAPEKWKPFVRNRVATIQETLPAVQWNYVSTEKNPADVISRGCDLETFRQLRFWQEGPHWLSSFPSVDATDNLSLSTEDSNSISTEEKVLVTLSCSVAIAPKDDVVSDVIERCGNYSKCCRIIAWVRRVLSSHRGEELSKHGLSFKEVQTAEWVMLRQIQLQHFADEVNDLKKNGFVKKSSALYHLSPIIDDVGLLRVGGRLDKSILPFDQKHPIIIPPQIPIIDSLIESTHRSLYHGGIQVTLNQLRRKYWIIRGSQRVKFILRRCVRCFRAQPVPMVQAMGHLPTPRTEFTKAFLHSGVDFAGPFKLKISPGRGTRTVKSYIAIFICLSVKAIHLEVVSSLTTDAFLSAMSRFVSRRGTVTDMYSDNGTNFVGAFRKLSHLDLSKQSIAWHFNPPAAPHFGGLWEAGVKSVKSHLSRTFSSVNFTFEELQTILCNIEVCLNSRPLCPLTEDPSSIDVLTPNHFLTGQSLIPIPEKDFSMEKTLIGRWEMCKALYQQVCKRYKMEYVSRLQQRPKWCRATENLREGQLVVVSDETTPMQTWPLGRVEKVHPGSDGLVRVACVRTQKGVKTRPVSKICPLPMNDVFEAVPPSVVNEEAVVVTPRRSPRIKLLNSLMVIGIFLFVLGGAAGQSVYNFKDEPGVHFLPEGRKHIVSKNIKIIVERNVTEIYNSLDVVENSLSSMERACQRLDIDCSMGTRIRSESLKVKNQFKALIQKPKTKRAAGLVVTGILTILGIGSAVYVGVKMSSLDSQVADVQRRQQQIMTLLDEHTGVFDKTLAVSRGLISETDRIKVEANKVWNETQNSFYQLKAQFELSQAIRKADAVVDQLSQLFTIIHSDGSNAATLPNIEDVMELQNVSSTLDEASKLTKNGTFIPRVSHFNELVIGISYEMSVDTLLVSFQIPVVNASPVTVYQPITTPVRHSDQLLWIETEAPWVAELNDTLQPVGSCRRMASLDVCWPQAFPWINCLESAYLHGNLSQFCRFKTTTVADYWKEIDSHTFVFAVFAPRVVRVHNTSVELNGTGILTMMADEQMVSLKSSRKAIFTPSFNLSREFLKSPWKWNNLAALNYEDLVAEVKKVKETHHQTAIEDGLYSFIVTNSYILGCGLIICVLLVVICTGCGIWIHRQKHVRKKRQQARNVVHDKFFLDIL